MNTLVSSQLSPIRMNENHDERVIQLLKPPTLSYIRELSKVVENDPDYLTFHSGSIMLRLKSLLAQQPAISGWDVPERQLIGTIKEAIVRLRSFEK